jgi:hypothetical protein
MCAQAQSACPTFANYATPPLWPAFQNDAPKYGREIDWRRSAAGSGIVAATSRGLGSSASFHQGKRDGEHTAFEFPLFSSAF